MYSFLRPFLFKIDPEKAHALSLYFFRLFGFIPFRNILFREFNSPNQEVRAFGLIFKNPVGLAAGYDKDGLAWRGLAALGFGHVEIGTVTPHPQPGNPSPRLFRLPDERALINRLGFPSRGAAFVAKQLVAQRPSGIIVGVNIGKNQATPLEASTSDYLVLMRQFAPQVDYLAINVSSPNTVGLRRLQGKKALLDLLTTLEEERQSMIQQIGRRTPILVKIAPDLTDEELADAIEVLVETNMDGVIASNTTVQRQGIRSSLRDEAGGLSGLPLKKRSTEMVRKIWQLTEGKLAIVGVGGVMSVEDVKEKLDAGAVLVQIYTGLVYQGPGLVRKILRGL